MKKLFVSLIAFVVMVAAAKVQAQCDIKDVVIDVPPVVNGQPNPQQSGANCNAYFNVTFKFNNNGGNKTVVIQAWKGDSQLRPPTDPNYDGDYPNYWQCNNGSSGINKAPTLTGANAGLRRTATPYSAGTPGPLPFLNIAFSIENFFDATPNNEIITTNYPGGGVTLQSGYTVSNISAEDAQGYRTITLSNLFVSIPNYTCGSGVNISADVWSSQASLTSGWTPHCVICNQNFAFNYPLVSGSVSCTTPRTYQIAINNVNTNQNITATWQVYLDDAPVGGVRGAEDATLVDQVVVPVSINAGNIYNTVRAYTGNVSGPNANKNLWLVVQPYVNGVPLDNTVNFLALIGAGCLLPAEFKTFTAVRTNRSTVALKWETLQEINVDGFAIERNVGGSWQQVGYVPTQAQGGNSVDILSYTFSDPNTIKAVSQYRIRQVDLDGRAKYSATRAVRGDGQTGKTIVYPNPTMDGRVTVVFEEANVLRDVTLVDMTGRVVKQWKSVTNNNIQIDNLTPGVFTLRILVAETGEQSVEKIVVNKR